MNQELGPILQFSGGLTGIGALLAILVNYVKNRADVSGSIQQRLNEREKLLIERDNALDKRMSEDLARMQKERDDALAKLVERDSVWETLGTTYAAVLAREKARAESLKNTSIINP